MTDEIPAELLDTANRFLTAVSLIDHGTNELPCNPDQVLEINIASKHASRTRATAARHHRCRAPPMGRRRHLATGSARHQRRTSRARLRTALACGARPSTRPPARPAH
jgi:hypothetical protein